MSSLMNEALFFGRMGLPSGGLRRRQKAPMTEKSPISTPPSFQLGSLFYALYAGVMNSLDLFFGNLQRVIGIKRMAYIFVLPNLLIFGIFVLFPMLLNFYYAFTGGTALFPENRPFVGGQNFAQLFDCENFLDP